MKRAATIVLITATLCALVAGSFVIPSLAWAKSQSWGFDVSGDYRYDPADIEVSRGAARLVERTPGELLWAKTYDGAGGGTDQFLSIDADDDGNTIALVKSADEALVNFTFQAIKFLADGSVAPGWPRDLSVTQEDNSTGAVTVSASGDIWAASQKGAAGSTNIIVWKLLPGGEPVTGWPKEYNLSTNDESPTGIVVDSGGNVVISARTRDGGDPAAGCIAKLKPDGTVYDPFPVKYVQPYETSFRGLAVDDLQNIFAVGSDQAGANERFLINSYTKDGTQRAGWPHTLAITDHNCEAWDAAIDSSQQLVLAGGCAGPVTRGVVIRYEPDGTPVPLWPRYFYHGDDPTYFLGLSLDNHGMPVVSGGCFPSGGPSYAITYRLTSSGEVTNGWPQAFAQGGANILSHCVTVDSAGNIVTGGQQKPEASPDGQALLLQYRASRFAAYSPSIEAVNPVSYSGLKGIAQQLGGVNEGTVLYQFSADGQNWRYWNGADWSGAISRTDKSSFEQSAEHIAGFADTMGSGTLFFKAFLDSDGEQQVELDEFSVDFDPGVTTWYLAEGYTSDNGVAFDTYVLIMNPSPDDAEIRMTYMKPNGEDTVREFTVGHESRYTEHLDEIPGLEDTEVSTRVEATNGVPIICERAMYFNYLGQQGGHDSLGVTFPCRVWYLPEGYTADGFDTYILVQNPGQDEARVGYSFMLADGSTVQREEVVGGHSRHTLKVDSIPELASCEVSTRVSADKPVVAERAMYFDYPGGRSGGHDSAGSTFTSSEWYLAEGYTSEEFDTFILLQNPCDGPVEVEATYMKPGGETLDQIYNLGSMSRRTVKLDDIPGLESAEVSTRLVTKGGEGIIAERSVYFNHKGLRAGGHNCIAVSEPSSEWYMAEGYTGEDFDSYVLIQNPRDEQTRARVSFIFPGHGEIHKEYSLAPFSRTTIHLNAVPGCSGESLSTRVVTLEGEGVICERSMYFTFLGRSGGHDAAGYGF